MGKIRKAYEKHREIILYIVFGILTTAVNWVSYMVAVNLLGGAKIALAVTTATIIGQLLSILFAYITNRKWVFQSKASGMAAVFAEMMRFFGCRGASFVLDIFLMWLGVTLLGFNDAWVKLGSNVVIIAVNFILSKLFIFKNHKGDS